MIAMVHGAVVWLYWSVKCGGDVVEVVDVVGIRYESEADVLWAY